MSAAWTLIYNGQEKTFTAWGIKDVQRKAASQYNDEVTFTVSVASDQAAPFPFDAIITIKRDGAVWFVGTVSSNPENADVPVDNQEVTVSGAWYQLDLTVFEQVGAQFNGSTFVPVYCTDYNIGQRVLWPTDNLADVAAIRAVAQPLGMWTSEAEALYLGMVAGTPDLVPAPTFANTRDVIAEVIAFAAGCGRTVACDAASIPQVWFAIEQGRDKSCTEIIRTMAKFIPDCVFWWDYSTTPNATLRCRNRAGLQSVTLPAGVKPLKGFGLTPRYDLLVPKVRLKYRVTTELNGSTYLDLQERSYPPAAADHQLGELVSTIDLQGYSLTQVSGSITAAAFDPSDITWWASKLAWLKDARIVATPTISNGTLNPAAPPAREMVSGQWASWMPSAVAPVQTEVRARITVTTNDSADKRIEDVAVKVNLTNAAIGTHVYTAVTQYDSGEVIPYGLEVNLYQAYSVLHYAGQINLVEQECGDWLASQGITDRVWIGVGINISGTAKTAWASMNATVQGYQMDLDSGRTTITVGPPEHLDPATLAGLLNRLNRNRVIYRNPAMQASGQAGGSNSVALPTEGVREAGANAPGQHQKVTVAQGGAAIVFDAIREGAVADKPQLKLVSTVSMIAHTVDLKTEDFEKTIGGTARKYDVRGRFLPVCLADPANPNEKKLYWVGMPCTKAIDPVTGLEVELPTTLP